MIQFKDFKREIIEEGGFFSSSKYEKNSETMLRMNYWIETNKIQLITIETVLIPELKRVKDQLADAAHFKTHSGEGRTSNWVQVFRLWYDDQETPSPPI